MSLARKRQRHVIAAKQTLMACHCTDCQKLSGTPFCANVVMIANNVTIAGPVQEYLKMADSGNERVQGFCGNCDSQIFVADPQKTLFMLRTGCFCHSMNSRFR
jgi:hypothetical protein